jgi:hypothetical protein
MLLITLVVRSTRQKGKALLALARKSLAPGSRPALYSDSLPPLNGTDKTAQVAIEGIVAHGPGGNQEKLLVL